MRRRLAIAVLAACGTSRPTNVVFVTSTVQSGAFGGLAAADAICAARARDAGLDGTFVAWLSDGQTSAFSRIAGVRGGWTLVDGTPIATSPSDLVTQSILAPIALDEHGHDVREALSGVWTGTRGDGTHDDDCAAWTSEDPMGEGTAGDAAAGGAAFTIADETLSCSSPRRLYCFETDRTAAISSDAQDGRYAFVSAAAWLVDATGGASADALCQQEAAAAQLPGTYLALLPQATATAASRFDATGPPWRNTAGRQLADTGLGLFTAGLYASFFDRHADGSIVPTGTLVWSGDPESDAEEGRCAGWTRNTALPQNDPQLPHVGDPSTSVRRDVFAKPYAYPNCDGTNYPVYCLEQ